MDAETLRCRDCIDPDPVCDHGGNNPGISITIGGDTMAITAGTKFINKDGDGRQYETVKRYGDTRIWECQTTEAHKHTQVDSHGKPRSIISKIIRLLVEDVITGGVK